MAALDFKQIFNDYIADTQKKWAHDRSTTLGASEVFGCIRKAWFSKRGAEFGYEKDPDYEESWGATRRGDLIENFHVVPAMKYLPPPAEIKYAGEDQETIVLDRNSATPDGLITGLTKDALKNYGVDNIKSNCIVLEIKSIDPRVNLKAEKDIHHGQTQVQMGIIRETTKFRPHYAVVLYIDASFLDDIKVFVVEFDEKKWEVAKKRAGNVWSIDDPKKLTPEGKFDGSCEYCPYTHACAFVTNGMIPETLAKKGKFVAVDDKLLETLLASYGAITEKKKAVEADYELIRQQIKERLVEVGDSRVQTDRGKVSWSKQKGRETLDTEAMEADGIDLGRYKKEGAAFDKLTITLDD